jgi:hypothetical protein
MLVESDRRDPQLGIGRAPGDYNQGEDLALESGYGLHAPKGTGTQRRSLEGEQQRGSSYRVRVAYNILNSLSPNSVDIHNSFNFDDRSLAASSCDGKPSNIGVGIFKKLKNGTMVVDLNVHCELRADDGTDFTNIVKYNAKDLDLHAWLSKDMFMCEHLCMFAGISWSTM